VLTSVDYYNLPKGRRWLGDSDPCEIEGRATDVSQIGLSLESKVKQLYSPRRIPNSIKIHLQALKLLLKHSEEDIKEFIELVNIDIMAKAM